MEAVRRQAVATFSKSNFAEFEENLRLLISTISRLSKFDVGLDEKLMRSNRAAPVTYVNVYEHEDVAVSMFILRRHSRLPLHDHPIMHGIIKVVSGVVEIQKYSFIDDPMECITKAEVLARKEPTEIISESDPPVLLTPSTGNIHEIICKDSEGAAIVDVLAPPYGSTISSGEPRNCHYYFQSDGQPPNAEIIKLIKSGAHPNYWTDVALYNGQ